MSYIAFLDSYFWYLVLLVNILVYLCGVRARKSANLFTRRAICLQDGEGDNNNHNMRFPAGVRKSKSSNDDESLAHGS